MPFTAVVVPRDMHLSIEYPDKYPKRKPPIYMSPAPVVSRGLIAFVGFK